jgi:hypothetical protein
MKDSDKAKAEEILDQNGFDFEAFRVRNEYSGNNILNAMEEYHLFREKEKEEGKGAEEIELLMEKVFPVNPENVDYKTPNQDTRNHHIRYGIMYALTEYASLPAKQRVTDELLNPNDYVSIEIPQLKEKWDKVFNVPNNGWNQVERDLLVVKDVAFPLTLRTYLINKIPHCVMIWMRDGQIPKK